MLALLLTLLSTPAQAEDVAQTFLWDLTLDGQKVGNRTMTVKYLPSDNGTRRIIESVTSLDATAKGVPYTFEQRITAHAGDEPASFHSVVNDNGKAREIQGRYTPMGWVVTVVDRGRTRTWELENATVDISSADLLDPETRVPLAGFTTVQILSVETGDVATGDIVNEGTGELEVGGDIIPVNLLTWTADTGVSKFAYTSDGVLARYEIDVMGRALIATLSEMPPPGVDDNPVLTGTAGITETDL